MKLFKQFLTSRHSELSDAEVWHQIKVALIAGGDSLITYVEHLDLTPPEKEELELEFLYKIVANRYELVKKDDIASYLFIVLHNLMLTQQRATSRLRSDLERFRASVFPHTLSYNPQEEKEAAQIREKQLMQLERAVTQLIPRHQLLIQRYYYEGLSYREISEMEGLTDSQVTNGLYRARRILNKKLNPSA